jgi:hypothetical protein
VDISIHLGHGGCVISRIASSIDPAPQKNFKVFGLI